MKGRVLLGITLGLFLAGCGGGGPMGPDEVKDPGDDPPPPPPPPPPAPTWEAPRTLVDAHGRLAIGSRLHLVGHQGSSLVHRSSTDDGLTWTAPVAVASAAQNYPMQYGGLYAVEDTVYLLTAAGDMGPSSRHLDFRKSTDNGATWSDPVRVTGHGQELRRANIVAHGQTVHVFGGQSGAGGYGTGAFYFRSTDGGATWEHGVELFDQADASTEIAIDDGLLHVAFGKKSSPQSFGGHTYYMRSTDGGLTWSEPLAIGEGPAEVRQQVAAADGRVIVMWQREASEPGGALPGDRLGFALSADGGATWSEPAIFPDDHGAERNHHSVWMGTGGAVHVAWSHGDPYDPTASTGYKFSPDYGVTWDSTQIALDTPGTGNLPHGVVADSGWVHLITEPGAGTYARKEVR